MERHSPAIQKASIQSIVLCLVVYLVFELSWISGELELIPVEEKR